jgi:predicted peptidase
MPVDTSWKYFSGTDFSAVHSPVNGDANEHLIFGAIPISTPAPDLAPELAAFLGRWEGYDYSPPVKKDNKGVLVIQEITLQGGRAFLWGATNLQFPFWVKEIQFKIVPGATPSIEWQGDLAGAPNSAGGKGTFTFAYDRDQHVLRGGINLPHGKALDGPFKLSQNRSFYVYEDYARYFASKRLYPKEFQNRELLRYGIGYLLYLPENYEVKLQQAWPLVIFLCGTGERGENIFLFGKNGPFQMIREKGPLPLIIVAPMRHVSPEFRSFPETYLDDVLAEIRATYRIDPKRIYLTGLSMDGEATYRFALHQPETFAAIAPLAAFDANYNPGAVREGFKPFTVPMERIEDVPVWAIHGADDTIVPLAAAQKTVDALKQAGRNVRFTILPNHDHDVWTDTYTDPAFYQWLLEHHKP